MTLLTKLENAAEGSRELDFAIWHGIATTLEYGTTEAPHYTTSLDAALPGENIYRVARVDTDSGYLWTAYQGHEFGTARTEAIARRLVALKARNKEPVKA